MTRIAGAIGAGCLVASLIVTVPLTIFSLGLLFYVFSPDADVPFYTPPEWTGIVYNVAVWAVVIGTLVGAHKVWLKLTDRPEDH